MLTNKQQLWILDVYSVIYRAMFKHGPVLTSPSGEVTSGVYLFCKILFSLIHEARPTYLVGALDVPRKETFRRAIYPPYKVSRKEHGNDDILHQQVSRCVHILKNLGIPLLTTPTYEADDVIASLVSVCAGPEIECVVASRDKDLHQVIGPYCRMFDHQTDNWIDAESVFRTWGVPPDKVVEVQTLSGDTTDNVPGVPGIGPAKASKLIQKYSTVQNLCKHLQELTPAVRSSLESTDLDLCRRLVELKTDASLMVSQEDMVFNGLNFKSVEPIFKELGFKQWL